MEQTSVLNRAWRKLSVVALACLALPYAGADVPERDSLRKPVSTVVVVDASKSSGLTLGVGVQTEHQAALLKNNLRTGKTKVVTCATTPTDLTRPNLTRVTNCVPVVNPPAGKDSNLGQVVTTPTPQNQHLANVGLADNGTVVGSSKASPGKEGTVLDSDYVPDLNETDASTVADGEFSDDVIDYGEDVNATPVVFEEVEDRLGHPYKFIVNNDAVAGLPGITLGVDNEQVQELRAHGYAFPDTGRDFVYGLYGYDDFGDLDVNDEEYQRLVEATFDRSMAYLGKQFSKFLPDGVVDKQVLNYVTNYRTSDVIDKFMNDLMPKINDYYWKVLDRPFVYEKLDWRKGQGANLDTLPVRAVYGYVTGWKQGVYQTFYQQATELFLDGSVSQSYDTYYAIVYGDGKVLPNNPQDKETWNYFFKDVNGAKQVISKYAPRYADILARGRVLTFNNIGVVIDAFNFAGREQLKATLVVPYEALLPYFKPEVAVKLGLVPVSTPSK